MKWHPTLLGAASLLIFLINATTAQTCPSLPIFPVNTPATQTCTPVRSLSDLQNINQNLSGNYCLLNDIDASATASWNVGAGFVPIGPFSGTFDGQGHIISGLTINATAINPSPASGAGLFALILNGATVRNVALTNEVVKATGMGTDMGAGGLAAVNFGTVTRSCVSGNISASTSSGHTAFVGGLVAENIGTVFQSRSLAEVQATSAGVAGGLVGTLNGGSITQSFASGSATAAAGYAGIAGTTAAGLVGVQLPGTTISQSYAIGPVTVGAGGNAAGLVGVAEGTITDSYAIGNVGNASFAGGLVARNAGATIIQSYWDTVTTGQASSSGGTPQTTADLRSGLPSGFDSSVWGIIANLNDPYLLWQVSYSQLVTAVNPAPYGALNPFAVDGHTSIEDEACLAVVYAMIAIAAGHDTTTVNDFWDTSKGATPAELFSWGVGISARPKSWSFPPNIFGYLKSGPIVIHGKTTGNEKKHWMLGLFASYVNGSKFQYVIAQDPWTGTEVAIDPNSGSITYVMDPNPLHPGFWSVSDLIKKPSLLPPSVVQDFSTLPLNNVSGRSTYDMLPGFTAETFKAVSGQ